MESGRIAHVLAVASLALTIISHSASSMPDASGRAPAHRGSRATENVIIVIIDGIRFQEVTEENMPFLLGGIDPDTGLPVPDPLKPQAKKLKQLHYVL